MRYEVANTTNSIKLPIGIDAWELLNAPGIELIQLELKSGEEVEPHVNPADVVFYLIEGQGVLTIENEVYKLVPGDCIAVPSGCNRAWKNYTKDLLKLLVIKSSE